MSKDSITWHKYPKEAPTKEGEYWVSEGEKDSAVYLATYSPEHGFNPGARIYIEVWAELDEDCEVKDEQI